MEFRSDVKTKPGFPWQALLFLLLLTLVYRIFVIIAPPLDFLKPPDMVIDGEELCRGNGAKDMIEGLLLPFQDYQFNDFWGGSLLVSVLAVPFFLLLGPTLVALRMSMLVFALITPIFAFLLLDRFVSRRAAWIGGLLLCLTPPGYTIYFSMAYGTHVESTSLAMIVVYLFMTSTYVEESSLLRHSLLGLVAGFAVSCGYGIIILLVMLLAFQVFHDKLFFLRKPFWIRAAGFVIGLAPWIRYNLIHDFAGIKLYERSLVDHLSLEKGAGAKVDKLIDFVSSDFANSFWFKDTLAIDGRLLGHAVVLLFTGLFIYALWRYRRSIGNLFKGALRSSNAPSAIEPITLFLAFPFIFLAAFLISDFKIIKREWVMSVRYILILYPFLVVIAAVVLDRLWNQHAWGRVFSPIVVVLLCGIFTAGTVLNCELDNMQTNWKEKGYSLKDLGRIIVLRYDTDTDMLDQIVARIEEPRPVEEQDKIFFSMAMHYRFLAKPRAGHTKEERASSIAYKKTLQHLHQRISDRFKSYFDPNIPTKVLLEEKFGADAASWRDAL